MKFSILSSIYYKENPQHFNECMISLWEKQTLKADEMVLVEDGELTSELYEIIQEWQNKLGDLLKVIKLPKNVGTGKAKNIGLQNCNYDIVCIVDTDDIYMRDRFEKQINFFKAHPDIDIIGGQIYEFIDDLNNISGVREVPLEHQELIGFSKKKSPFNNMTIAYKKEAIINVGGYHHHLWMEDYNLFLRLIANGYKLQNLPDFLVYARIDNGMHGRRRGWQYIQSEKQLFDLKLQLKIQPLVPATMLFLVRSAFRLLPSALLGKVYNSILRNGKKF